MAVTGTITTKFVDEKGVDLGRQLVEKDYLISVYPNLVPQLKSAGLFVWGNNFDGQLGDNTITHRSYPIQTIAGGTNWSSVAGGGGHTAAIKTDGTLWLWGRNYNGQLGDNTTVYKSSPFQVVGFATNWSSVSCGGSFTAAIKTDGTLWNWGRNNNGQLGHNTTTHRSSPVQTIAGGTNWNSVACGGGHTAAIKTDGTLWLWGYNYQGQLGENTRTDRSSPIQTIAGGTNWSKVACGGAHTAAIKTDGTIWVWGKNSYYGYGGGQVGDNTTVGKSSPVQTIAGGTNWIFVACGSDHTAAIKTDGTLWLWGGGNYGTSGELGDNTVINKSSPVQTIAGGTNWSKVACGYGTTAAIKSDGTLWTLGINSYGAMGDNTVINKSSPVQTIVAGNNWKQVACGKLFTAAIRDANY
jgi:alpha-tubulin suppressor-like RCC1 family protein